MYACGLKQFALKHMCLPLEHDEPTAAWLHLPRLKLKHNGLPFASRPTPSGKPFGATNDPFPFPFDLPLAFPL